MAYAFWVYLLGLFLRGERLEEKGKVRQLTTIPAGRASLW
jgi:hypothetical protein